MVGCPGRALDQPPSPLSLCGAELVLAGERSLHATHPRFCVSVTFCFPGRAHASRALVLCAARRARAARPTLVQTMRYSPGTITTTTASCEPRRASWACARSLAREQRIASRGAFCSLCGVCCQGGCCARARVAACGWLVDFLWVFYVCAAGWRLGWRAGACCVHRSCTCVASARAAISTPLHNEQSNAFQAKQSSCAL